MQTESVTDLEQDILQSLQQVRAAVRKMIHLTDADISAILLELAELTLENMPMLLAENQKDLDRMDPTDPKYDRLLLNPQRLEAIAADLRQVAHLPSPLGKILEERTLPNGLQLSRISVPMGVIGIVFESRPNVTFDVFALCLRSGNACVLKGSRDAHYSNLAILDLIRQVLATRQLADVCYLAPSERESLGSILQAVDLIDLIIPRGSQGLIDYVRANARVPVIETGAGIVHTYYDAEADLAKGKAIITNAKARRVSVCNALDTLLIHRSRLADLPALLVDLDQKYHCEVRADAAAFTALEGHYAAEYLRKAQAEDFGTEFLSMKMSVKTVDNLEEALDHIDRYSSKHSEAIVSENEQNVAIFLRSVDAAVVYANASTAFTDGGQFGLGAEIGISTQKMHARGPMALRELTSYKWVIRGEGQIRG